MYLDSSSAYVNWTAQDNVGIGSVRLRVDGGAWMSVAVTDVSVLLSNLSEGSHLIELEVFDEVGNNVTVSVTIITDTIDPTAVVGPTGHDVPLDSSIVITFSEAMNTTDVVITVDDLEGTVSWSGNVLTFHPMAMLYNAIYVVKVTGTDLAGNEVQLTWTFSTATVGYIEGYVKDSSGNAIANATVKLSNNLTATTDANGHFLFENVTLGNYTVTVTKDGFVGLTLNVTVLADTTSNLDVMTLTSTTATTKTSDSTWLYIVIGIVAVIVVGGVAWVVLRRKD